MVQFDLSQYAPGVVKPQAEVYNAVSNSTYQTSDDKLQQRKRNPQNSRMTNYNNRELLSNLPRDQRYLTFHYILPLSCRLDSTFLSRMVLSLH